MPSTDAVPPPAAATRRGGGGGPAGARHDDLLVEALKIFGRAEQSEGWDGAGRGGLGFAGDDGGSWLRRRVSGRYQRGRDRRQGARSAPNLRPEQKGSKKKNRRSLYLDNLDTLSRQLHDEDHPTQHSENTMISSRYTRVSCHLTPASIISIAR
eukprot:contig_7578_g1770